MEATKNKADLGIAVDPDVDRLALVDHEGQYFGEEYSLICCADFMLDVKPGNTVSIFPLLVHSQTLPYKRRKTLFVCCWRSSCG